MTPEFVISTYDCLFEIEKSFRMAKSDLAARPTYHRKRDSINAHLTIVFAAWPSAGGSKPGPAGPSEIRPHHTPLAHGPHSSGWPYPDRGRPLPDDLRDVLARILVRDGAH